MNLTLGIEEDRHGVVVRGSTRPGGAEVLLNPFEHASARHADIGRAIIEGDAVHVEAADFSGQPKGIRYKQTRGERSDMSTSRIEINPNVMLGKPVVRGTRIPVELVLRKLGEGASMDDLCDAYPRLKAEDIYACLAYAAATVAHEETLSTEPA